MIRPIVAVRDNFSYNHATHSDAPNHQFAINTVNASQGQCDKENRWIRTACDYI